MCLFPTKNLFLKIPVKLPKQSNPRGKRQSLLHDIGGGGYVKKLSQKLPPIKKSKLS